MCLMSNELCLLTNDFCLTIMHKCENVFFAFPTQIGSSTETYDVGCCKMERIPSKEHFTK